MRREGALSERRWASAGRRRPGNRGPRRRRARGDVSEACNAVVHIHKRFYGKGPTKARAHLSHDLLTVVLEGGFTRGEETLSQSGHEGEVLRSRIAMQHSVEDVFRDAIEGIAGRRVRSFMSANDPEHGVQVEVFVFEPEQSGRSEQG